MQSPAQRGRPARRREHAPLRRAAPVQKQSQRKAIVAKALPMEFAQLADEGGFIGGVALTMCAITLLVSGAAR